MDIQQIHDCFFWIVTMQFALKLNCIPVDLIQFLLEIFL